MSERSHHAWIRPFLASLAPVFREVLAISLFVNLLALAVPVFVLQVYDRVVFHGGLTTLQGLAIGMVVVIVFDYVLRQGRARIMQTVAARADVYVGRRLFDKFMTLPLRALESHSAAYWHVLFRDVDVIRNTVSGASAILIADLPFVLLFIALTFVIAAPIAWVLLLALPFFLFVAWRSGRVMAAAGQAERDSGLARDRLISEMVAGRTTIKALALDTAMRPLWEEKHASTIERAVLRGGRMDAYATLGTTLTMTMTVALTTIGAVAIVQQELTIGALIATNLLAGRIAGPLTQLVGMWRTYSSFGEAVKRVGRVLAMPGEREEPEIELERPAGAIKLEAVTYGFGEGSGARGPGDRSQQGATAGDPANATQPGEAAHGDGGRPVIDALSLTIKARTITALVGPNGSGKTTLLKLIQGLYAPLKGRILLDGADVGQFTRRQMASWIGYVPQDCVLFAGSLRENIALRKPDATDEEVIAAARTAGAHEFILDLPDGYATNVGESGQRLSAGQRQRIAIARALLGDPPVLLMDEPSSNLDHRSETELARALAGLGQERTIVIVTHSPVLLSVCAQLVALDRGRIAIAGPSADVLPRLLGQAQKAERKVADASARRPARVSAMGEQSASLGTHPAPTSSTADRPKHVGDRVRADRIAAPAARSPAGRSGHDSSPERSDGPMKGNKRSGGQ